jgi:hypothetical protein
MRHWTEKLTEVTTAAAVAAWSEKHTCCWHGCSMHGVLLLQVGKDKRAQAFLAELDKHPEVGSR